MTDSQQGTTHLVGCSVRGPGHIENDTPCQDSHNTLQLPNARVAIAVGDGVGSASHSEEGSAIATQEAVDGVREYLDEADAITRETAEEALEEAVTGAREAVTQKAEELEEPADELATTLLVAVVGPTGLACVVVGDGGVVYEQNSEYKLLVPREMEILDLPASNVTIPLTNDRWQESYRFGYQEAFDGLAVFSDGLDEFAWGGIDTAREEFFGGVFELVRDIPDEEKATEELSRILSNEPYENFSDDKTLVITDIESEASVEPVSDELEESTTPEAEDSETEEKSAETVEAEASAESGESDPPTEPPSDDVDPDPPARDATPSKDKFEDTSVTTRSGTEVILGQVIDSSDHSCTYRVEGRSSIAVKIFSKAKRGDSDLAKKLDRMVANPPVPVTEPEMPFSFAWPTDIIETESMDRFLGYRMSLPEMEGSENILEAAKKYSRDSEQPSGIMGGLLDTIGFGDQSDELATAAPALSLAKSVDTLHRQGHAFGDLDHERIHIVDDQLVLTDCERYHINGDSEDYHGADPVSRYGPPEDVGDTIQQVQESDRFGLTVHIFQLLMGGFHPYQPQGWNSESDSWSEIISDHRFLYHDPQARAFDLPADAPAYEALPAKVRTRFDESFIKGHADPEARPSADTWVSTLEDSQ